MIDDDTPRPDTLVETVLPHHEDGNEDNNERRGTITSARFNILSTMVGGGALSVPLAFHQAGNVFLAPILLFIFAALVKTSIHLLVGSAIMSQHQGPPDTGVSVCADAGGYDKKKKGTLSYEATACAAFGPKARYLAMSLVATICYLTVVGYGVLLRDMLLPLSDYIFGSDESSSSSGPTFHHNITMLTVVLFVSPLCTMKDLTPLEKVGALSMMSITAVACCISYRSFQCNFSSKYDDIRLMPWYEYINVLPEPMVGSKSSFHSFLDAIPILINIYMCHFNVLPVHNELQNPSPSRVNALFSSSIWGACIFYLFVGFTGSMYGNCTPDGQVEGNVLLSFDEDDALLLVGRFCLSLTITFAFPVLVVPCRDILLRAWDERGDNNNTHSHVHEDGAELDNEEDNSTSLSLGVNTDLAEPLLLTQVDDADDDRSLGADSNTNVCNHTFAKRRRRFVSIIIFWSGAAVACCVKSIDIVWDLLGGSLSLMMGFLIPSAAFSLVWKRQSIVRNGNQNEGDDEQVENGPAELALIPADEESNASMITKAYLILALFCPMVVILTGNAIYNLRNE